MSNFFYDSIVSRLQKENKNFNCFILGEPGSGKSWSGLRLCSDLSKIQNIPFSADNVCFTTKDFLKLVEKRMEDKLPRGSCILYDEFAVSADADLYRGEDSIITLKNTFSTFRAFGLATFATFPGSIDFTQKKLRTLFHSAILLDGVNTQKGFSHGRVHMLSPGVYNSKLYKSAPSGFDENGNEVTMGSLKFYKPPQDLIEAYEEKQLAFKKNLIRERMKLERLKEDKIKMKNKPLSEYYSMVLKKPVDYLNKNGTCFSYASLMVHLNLPEKRARALALVLNADWSNGRIKVKC